MSWNCKNTMKNLLWHAASHCQV